MEKLIAIGNADAIDQYVFTDLVDVDVFTQLLESFFKATGIPNGLVDPDGELITQAGWTVACAQFHRLHPETRKRCLESNIELMSGLRQGYVSGCLCGNGLIDYATPVVVEGQQLATLFLGQVFSEVPDLEQFRKQAAQFDFEPETYLDAIRAVPVISRDKLEANMAHMVEMAQVLAVAGLARLREQRLQKSLQETTEKRIQVEHLLDNSPVGISWCDADGNIEYVNHYFTELFGYTIEDIPDLTTWVDKAYADGGTQKEKVQRWAEEAWLAKTQGAAIPDLESDIVCKNGSVRHVLTRVSWVAGRRLANFTDITAHWMSERRNRLKDSILEMVARAQPLRDILREIVHSIELESPQSLCSILLLDSEERHLFNGAAPSLPEFYNAAINGIEIGVGVGSCGTAAFTGKRVVVEDLMTHEYWRPYAELAKKAGLGACWSEPILSSKGKVLGTFAIYHNRPATPLAEDIERITFAANSASIAIENHQTREALEVRERQFRSLAENAPDNIARYDTDARLVYMNPLLAETFGDQAGEMIGKRPGEHAEDDRYSEYEDYVKKVIASGEPVELELEILTPDGAIYHQIRMVAERDESGAVSGVLSIGRNITDRREMEVQLTQSEQQFRSLAEASPDNVIRFDKQMRVRYINRNLLAFLGFDDPDQLLGYSPDDIESEIRVPEIEEGGRRVLASGREETFELTFLGPDDGLLYHQVSLVPERSSDGEIIGAIAFGRDLTRLKQAEISLEKSNARFQTLFDSSPDSIWVFDGARCLDCNQAAVDILGYTDKQQLLGLHPAELSPSQQPDGSDSYTKAEEMIRIAKERRLHRFEWVHRKADGSDFTAEVTLSPIELDNRPVVYAIWRDVSERKAMQARMDLLEDALNNSADEVHVIDCESLRFEYANDVICKNLGFSSDELSAMTPADIDPDFTIEHLRQLISELKQAGSKTFETRHQRRDGSAYPVEINIVLVTHLGRDYALGIARDITERKQIEHELERQARLDYLTKLANHRYFIEQAEHEVSRFRRYSEALSLMMFDIDFFKQVNDTHGHKVGDLVLQKVADTCRATLREIDIAGRIGGEEFAVLMPQTDLQRAVEAAERLRIAIGETVILLPDRSDFSITASFGVVMIRNKDESLDEAMIRADKELYRAKASGRNQVCMDES